MRNEPNQAKHRAIKFSALMLALVALNGCGGGGGDSSSPPATNNTVPPVTTVTSKVIQPRVAADVSLLDSQKITKINSLASSSAVGQGLTVNVAEATQQGMLIATDANDNPLLFSIENSPAIGIDSTAYALVVMVMKMADLPADLDLNTVQGNIRQVASYAGLKTLLSENLSNNIVSIDSPEVMALALTVLDDAIRLNAPVPAASARSGETKAASTSIFPHYLFDSSATNKMWLSGADASGLELKNRTFLRWQVVLKNKDGQQVHKDHIAPMKTTAAQLYAYYGNSESSLKIPTTLIRDEFKIEVSQTPQTETANAFALVNKSVFAIVDFSLGAAGVKSTQVQSCATAIANTLTNSPQFGAAVTSTNIQNWIAYLDSITGRVPELLAITCNSQLDKSFGLANASSSFKTFFNRFNKALSVARDATGAINGFVQFNTHHNKTYTADLCFKDGQVTTSCGDYVKIGATGQQLPDSATAWDCVLDKKTGLMWENKTDDGGLRDKDHLYSWFENSKLLYTDTPYGGHDNCKFTLGKCNTKEFIAAVNTQALCGYRNWRLPSRDELQEIGFKNDKNKYFLMKTYGYYDGDWSSTPDASHGVEFAWAVGFFEGSMIWREIRFHPSSIRAVRVNQ